MPLHTDYRPDAFESFVGSASTVSGIQKKLKGKDPAHVYLITGPSGCGKTTLGRIIGRTVGALLPDEDPEKSLNYREYDSADFRGIDTIRDIRKGLRLSPIGGAKARVWLLDECHQLTKDAQEALLKALEGAKGHVYFVLATTNPEKLKDTLKRRCSEYKVAPVTSDDMMDFLWDIVEWEKKNVPEDILMRIEELAQGSIGKALAILDRVIDLSEEDMKDQLQTDPTDKQTIDLCRALIKKSKWVTITKIIDGILKTEEPETARRKILGYCSTILMKEDNSRAYLIMDAFRSPFFDTPKPQFILAAYESLYAE